MLIIEKKLAINRKILEKPQIGHGIFTLLAGTLLPACICIHIKYEQSKHKNSKSLLKTHESDIYTYSESETEKETEDYKNGNDSNNSSDNSTQTNGIQQSEKESYGIQFEPVGERLYMRKPKGLGGRYSVG